MFFKKGSNFPHSMAISNGVENFYAYLSSYDEVNHTYHVTFAHSGSYEMMDNVVLNGNIFTLYEEDTELSDSQNRRMANMTVAMGVWGSLYATFEQQNSVAPDYYIPRGIISSFFRGVAQTFGLSAVAATVVAFVVAPVVLFIDPVAGMAIASVAVVTGGICAGIAAAAFGLSLLFDELEAIGSLLNMFPTTPEGGIPKMLVTLVYENNRSIKYNENGNHEEFHIGPNKNMEVEFYMSGANFSNITTDLLYQYNMIVIDEPEREDEDPPINRGHFKSIPAEVVVPASPDPEKLRVKIMRTGVTTPGGNTGKINFGFIFFGGNDQTMTFSVNDYTGGFDFRLPLPERGENGQVVYETKRHNNMVVIYFCLVENCPDIPPTPVPGGGSP
jgi:hypothetical protein